MLTRRLVYCLLSLFLICPAVMADQFSRRASEKGFTPAEIEYLRAKSKLEGFSELEYKQRYQGPIIDVLDHTHRFGFETNERHENLPTGKNWWKLEKLLV